MQKFKKHSEIRKILCRSFFKFKFFTFSVNIFFLQFLVDILLLGSGYIFADPDLDSGSQNLADPTDPDPKHWSSQYNVYW